MKHMNREASFSQFLTITSPLASKRECKANSELVPPPGNALEQHKFRRFSTVGNKERPLHQKELRVTGKTNRSWSQRPPGEDPALPAQFFPCCQYLFAGSRGFPALARASIPVWPCVCPGPGQRHPGVLGSPLGISSQC